MIAHAILSLCRIVVGSLLLLGLLLNFANVIARYIFASPIMSAEEILTYGMIWCIFLGALLVTWEGRHLRMDLFLIVMPPKLRLWLAVLSLALFAVVCATVAISSVEVVILVWGHGERSVVAQIPMMIPYLVLPLGFGLMSLAVLLRSRALAQAAEAGLTEIAEASDHQQLVEQAPIAAARERGRDERLS